MQERLPQEVVEHVIDQTVVGNTESEDELHEWLYAANRAKKDGKIIARLPSRPVNLNRYVPSHLISDYRSQGRT